jgi:hypothetical protein
MSPDSTKKVLEQLSTSEKTTIVTNAKLAEKFVLCQGIRRWGRSFCAIRRSRFEMSTVACMSRASRGALNEWDPFVPIRMGWGSCHR